MRFLLPPRLISAAATFSFVVGCLTFREVVDATSIKMDFLPSGHVRTDPIISQTCLSDHIHTYYGPNILPYPDITFDELMATPIDQLTGNVEENKSLYWHPTIFRYDRATQTYTRDEIGQSSAYYIWENMVPGETRAFPENFRMIAGTNGNTATEFPNAIAECVNPSPCQRDDCHTENDFFPSTACEELEVSMFFPGCWDGVNVDSPDHTSHVAYTVDGDVGGDCPASHPVRIPTISFFFRIFNYDGGWHMFADESSTYHADYMSGWDVPFLQSVLDNCENDSFAPMPNAFCEDFVTFRDGPKCTNEATCDFADPELLTKLQEIQPDLLDFKKVSPEETDIIQGQLPRGTCNGVLLPRSCDNIFCPPEPITESPSQSASAPPSIEAVSESPSQAPPACENEESFYYRGKMRTCEWASHIFCRKRLERGEPERVYDVCQLACWQYCDPDEEACDDVDSFILRGKERTCEWAGDAWCNLGTKDEYGSKVRDHCREWCDMC